MESGVVPLLLKKIRPDIVLKLVQHYSYEYIRNAEYTVDSMQVSGTRSGPVAQYSIVKPTVR